MKSSNYIKFSLFIAVALYLGACTADEKPSSVTKAQTTVKSVNPFPFYKNIEIKPGYHFEVVSWGKGVDTLGVT
jgi:hypothetical protein